MIVTTRPSTKTNSIVPRFPLNSPRRSTGRSFPCCLPGIGCVLFDLRRDRRRHAVSDLAKESNQTLDGSARRRKRRRPFATTGGQTAATLLPSIADTAASTVSRDSPSLVSRTGRRNTDRSRFRSIGFSIDESNRRTGELGWATLARYSGHASPQHKYDAAYSS